MDESESQVDTFGCVESKDISHVDPPAGRLLGDLSSAAAPPNVVQGNRGKDYQARRTGDPVGARTLPPGEGRR